MPPGDDFCNVEYNPALHQSSTELFSTPEPVLKWDYKLPQHSQLYRPKSLAFFQNPPFRFPPTTQSKISHYIIHYLPPLSRTAYILPVI